MGDRFNLKKSQKMRMNHRIGVPADLRQILRDKFQQDYIEGNQGGIGQFLMHWEMKLPEKLPTDETIRKLMRREEQNRFQYWVIDGCTRLLLGCTLEEWIDRSNRSTITETSEQTVAAENPLSKEKSTLLLHNLPNLDCNAPIGRENEISKLLEFLAPYQPARRISVEGIGGVGKTTLVLETAYRCLDFSSRGIGAFDAIIFTSAQPRRLTDSRIWRRLKRDSNINDIIRSIELTLKYDITPATFEVQLERICDRLRLHRTLLIIDNLETLEDKEDVLSLIYELPPKVKVVITSRQQVQWEYSICLQPLKQADSLHLIQQQVKTTPVSVSEEECQQLYEGTGGIPAAIDYIIGQLRAYRSLPVVLSQLTQATGDIPRFWFDSSLQLLQGQPSHYLLMAATFFPKPALKKALAFVALPETAPAIIDESFAQLQQLFLLINRPGYDMLPLTRGYVLTEIEAYPDFEAEARQRWIEWYLQFSAEYGIKDEKEWHEYGQLESEWDNLRAAMQWCIEKERYEEFLQFWRNVRSYSYAQGYYKSDRLIYWHVRLEWTDWLIKAAEQRGELSTVAEVMFDRAWTLTLMGGKLLEEASTLFARAWKLRNYLPPSSQIELVIHIAVMRLQQQQFHQARRWLKQSQKLLGQSQPSEQQRLQIHIHYYQGEICFKTGEYHQAQSHYQQALDLAKTIDWKRAVSLAKNWLGDIAVKLGNLDEARVLLEECLRTAKENDDNRRTAFCKYSMAFLWQAQGNLTEARRIASEAIEEFNSLGMITEAEEIRSWLQHQAS